MYSLTLTKSYLTSLELGFFMKFGFKSKIYLNVYRQGASLQDEALPGFRVTSNIRTPSVRSFEECQ